jgi:hypothetical protein
MGRSMVRVSLFKGIIDFKLKGSGEKTSFCLVLFKRGLCLLIRCSKGVSVLERCLSVSIILVLVLSLILGRLILSKSKEICCEFFLINSV